MAKGAEYYPRVPLGALVRAKLEAMRWDAEGPVSSPRIQPPATPKKPAVGPAPAPAKVQAAKPADAVQAAVLSVPAADAGGVRRGRARRPPTAAPAEPVKPAPTTDGHQA